MFRKIVLLLLSFIFLIVFTIWFTIFNLKFFFLKSDYWKQVFVRSGVYPVLVQTIPDLAMDQINFEELNLPFEITSEEIRQLVITVFPSAYLQGQTEHLLDESFGFLFDGQEDFDFSLSFQEPKAKFYLYIQEVIPKKLAQFPVCTAEQLSELESEGDTMLLCRPPDIDQQAFVEMFMSQENLDKVLPQIPDTYTFFPEGSAERQSFLQNTTEVRLIISLILTEGFYVSLGISVLLLLLIGVIARPMSSRFRWWGGNLLNFAIWPFFLSLVSLFTSERWTKIMLNSFGGKLPQNILGNLSPPFQIITRGIWEIVLKESIFLLVLAVVCYLLARLFQQKENQEQELQLIKKVEEEERGKKPWGKE